MDSFELELYLELAKDADNENDIKTADIIDKLIREAAPLPRPKSTPAGSDPTVPAPRRPRARKRKPDEAKDSADFEALTGGNRGNLSEGPGPTSQAQIIQNFGGGPGSGDAGISAKEYAKALADATIKKQEAIELRKSKAELQAKVDALNAELEARRREPGPEGEAARETPDAPDVTAPAEEKKNWLQKHKRKLITLGISSGLLGAAYVAQGAIKPNVDRSSTTPTGATPPTTVPSAETGAGPDFSQESKRDQASQQRNATKAQQFIDQYMPQFGTRIKNQRDWYNLALQESNKFTGKARDFNFANTVISFIKRLQAPPIPGGSAPGTF